MRALFLLLTLVSFRSHAAISKSDIVGLTPNGSGLLNCQVEKLQIDEVNSAKNINSLYLERIKKAESDDERKKLEKRLRIKKEMLASLLQEFEQKKEELYALVQLKNNPFSSLPQSIETDFGHIEVQTSFGGTDLYLYGPDVCFFNDDKYYTPTRGAVVLFLNSLLESLN